MSNWVSRFTVCSPPMLTRLLSLRYANSPYIVYIEKQVTEKKYGDESYLKVGLISSYCALI
jgi:hypothetical protein